MAAPKGKYITKDEIKFDDRNTNRHTERGEELVEKSFNELGAGRSILSDRNGKIIAGNLSASKAIQQGKKLLEVETDGDTLVVVKRKDLDLDGEGEEGRKARQMAIADNSTASVSYNPNFEVMAEIGVEYDFDVEEWGVVVPNYETPDYSDRNKEIDIDGFEDKCILKLEYTLEEYEIVKTELAKHGQTPEAAVFNLLGLNEKV